MDGAPILCIEIAQNKAYTALFGVSTHELFDFIKRSLALAGMPRLRVCGVGRRVSDQGGRRNCRGDRAERGAHGAERHRLCDSSAGARI